MFTKYTENNSNSLDLLWNSGCVLLRDMTGARFEKVLFWFGLRLVPSGAKVLMTWQQRVTALQDCRYTGKWLSVKTLKKLSYINTHKSFHIYMRIDMQNHTGKCKKTKARHESQDPHKHLDTSKWHPKYAYMHMIEERFLCEKSIHERRNTQTLLDTCSDLLSLLLFFCLAFHVQSLVCDSCLSAEEKGREHNLCDGVEVKKEKKMWQNEWKAGENV